MIDMFCYREFLTFNLNLFDMSMTVSMVLPKIILKIFETNSSFHVKQHPMGKV